MADGSLLSVRLRHRQGALQLGVDFHLRSNWSVLFGPSGSGKSTVLRAIAGFIKPNEGSIRFGPRERTLTDTAARLFVAPYLRPVRSAAQAAHLFPGMRVLANVAFGVGSKEGRRDHADKAIEEILELFQLSSLTGSWPDNLSGGERQRVSVARAVAAAVTFGGPGNPVLLLDEPFSGLDVVLRDALALELASFLKRRNIPVLSVSHDVGEAFLLRAEIIRMSEGQIVEQGPVDKVLRGERERLLAQLQQ